MNIHLYIGCRPGNWATQRVMCQPNHMVLGGGEGGEEAEAGRKWQQLARNKSEDTHTNSTVRKGNDVQVPPSLLPDLFLPIEETTCWQGKSQSVEKGGEVDNYRPLLVFCVRLPPPPLLFMVNCFAIQKDRKGVVVVWKPMQRPPRVL